MKNHEKPRKTVSHLTKNNIFENLCTFCVRLIVTLPKEQQFHLLIFVTFMKKYDNDTNIYYKMAFNAN